ncbi:MAG: mechanosensitive ion channel domain-containing protein [Thermodesulfobacteriota bacterium]
MENLIERWLNDPVARKIVFALLGILIIYGLVRLMQKWSNRVVEQPDTRYRLRKFFTFLGYVIGIFLLANIFSDRLGQLTLMFGVIGAGIAFALQEVIISIAGWIALSFGNFYKIGDRVQLGGITGDVIDMGVLRTTLMETGQWIRGDVYNGRIVRVANSFVFKEPVFNYSADFPFLWDEITIPVHSRCDHRLVKDTLMRIAREITGDYADFAKEQWNAMMDHYRIEPASLDPQVILVLTDKWMQFTVRFIVDYRKRGSTKTVMYEKILDAFAQSAGRLEIASSSQDIGRVPVIDVRVSGGKDTA